MGQLRFDRRHVLRALAVLGGGSLLELACRSSTDVSRPAPVVTPELPRPRHLVLFFMRGGMDAVLTTAPKRSNEVDEQVDVPYQASEIFTVNGKQYGPQLRPLERHLGDVAIVNGVYAGSLQHAYGAAQLLRMKQRVTFDVPSIGEVIGGHFHRHPLTSVALGKVEPTPGTHPPGLLSCTVKKFSANERDLCDEMTDMSREELGLAAEGLERLSTTPDGGPEVRASARDVAALFRRLESGTVPKPTFETWLPEIPVEQRNIFDMPRNEFIQRDVQRALWFLENELATCVTVQPRNLDWDSHTGNIKQQAQMNGAFFSVLARFLDELKVRRNAHGTLASQTVVVMASEMGRLPKLNDQRGKDHFLEMPMLVIGPRVNSHDEHGGGAIYGSLGRRLEAQPLDRMTGRASATGSIPTLSDVGATLLAAFGINPRQYGHTGRPLGFLMNV
jgi:hypothetical protein